MLQNTNGEYLFYRKARYIIYSQTELFIFIRMNERIFIGSVKYIVSIIEIVASSINYLFNYHLLMRFFSPLNRTVWLFNFPFTL